MRCMGVSFQAQAKEKVALECCVQCGVYGSSAALGNFWRTSLSIDYIATRASKHHAESKGLPAVYCTMHVPWLSQIHTHMYAACAVA